MGSVNVPSPNHHTLCLRDLRVGETAVVVGYASRTAYTHNLLRLGLIPGTLFRVERRAPLGDPVEIRFRGFSLALRPMEADDLLVRRP
ncbi:MAG: FeoA family protein [Pseudomonadales bacterium]|nr:ferrous iron transport protein A [Pseudomonadales bacterium]